VRIALFQPDIPQNTGTILRMAACLGIKVDIIEPAGFDVSDRNLKRAGMDYLNQVSITRHSSWSAFHEWQTQHGLRLVLATVHGKTVYTRFHFTLQDILMLGRESAGFPEEIHKSTDHSVVIPMQKNMRSLNIAVSGAMIIGEALRQTHPLWSPSFF